MPLNAFMKYEIPYVTALQKRLAELGHYKGKVDGDYGRQTEAAVKSFQTAAALVADGDAGPNTIAALTHMPMEPIIPIHKIEEAKAWPTQSQVPKFFGAINSNQVRMIFPYQMRLAWDTSSIVKSTSCHEKIRAPARRALVRTLEHYGQEKITELGLDLFGGCLNPRRMRGGSAWSMHSWGIAFDFDQARNQLSWGRDRAQFAKPEYDAWWRFWEDEGAVSLGRAKNYDWMHVQFARVG